MIKVVSFDVDGTLIDSTFVDLVWLEGVPTLYAEKYNVDFETAQKRVIKEYDNIGEEDIRWYQLDYWFDHFQLEGSHHELLNTYKDKIRAYEEVPSVLNRLSKKYALIVASNAHRDFLSLTLSGMESYFDHIFSATSDFEKVRKFKEFYHGILNQLHVRASEMAHVGDHYTFDYEVPKGVGIHAFFLDRKEGKGLKDLKEFEEKLMELEKLSG